MNSFWFKKKLRMFQPKREKKQHNKREREREKREKIFFLLCLFHMHECTYLFTIFFFFRIYIIKAHRRTRIISIYK